MVEELTTAIGTAGSQFGMSLHWDKFQALSVSSPDQLRKPDGSYLEDRDSLVYLGGLLSRDGRAESEVSRRLGMAAGEFRKIKQVWSHAGLTKPDKLKYFQAFVLSKLRYGLGTCWLVKSQQRRLDGFHARCLRRIAGIQAAFISRVSNAKVFEAAGTTPFSEQLRAQQLLLLGRVGRSPEGGPLRRDTFWKGTARPMVGHYVRRVGRPRHDGTTELLADAERLTQSHALLEAALIDPTPAGPQRWKRLVRK